MFSTMLISKNYVSDRFYGKICDVTHTTNMTSSNFSFLNHVKIASLVTVFDADFNGMIGFKIGVQV